MNNQKLIEEIVNELYKRLQQETKVNLHKKKVVLIGNHLEQSYKSIEEMYEVLPYSRDIRDFDSVIICEMNISRLSRLALGCSEGAEEEFILKALLEGKKIYMLEESIEYRKYKRTSYKALYNLYSDYEDKLKHYGIKTIYHIADILLKEDQINRALVIESEINNSKKIDFTHKKLLLETDLMRTAISGLSTIVVNKKCIVTPLAEDFIRTHKLKIKKI